MDEIPGLEQSDELKALGFRVVDQASVELRVEAEVDEAFVKHSRKQKLQILLREEKEINLNLVKLTRQKNDLKFRLSGMRQRLVDPRKYDAVEKELKDKSTEIHQKKSRVDYIGRKVKEAEINASVLDDVNLELEEGELAEEEEGTTEKDKIGREKLIMGGDMTPFGSLLQPNLKQNKVDHLKEAAALPLEVSNAGPQSHKGCQMPATVHRGQSAHQRASFENEMIESSEETFSSISSTLGGVETNQADKLCKFSKLDKYIRDQMGKQMSFLRDFPGKDGSSKSRVNNNKTRKRLLKEFQPVPDQKRSKSGMEPKSKTKEFECDQKKSEYCSKSSPTHHWEGKNRQKSKTLTNVVDANSDPDYVLSERDTEEEEDVDCSARKSDYKTKKQLKLRIEKITRRGKISRIKDDGHVKDYMKRVKRWRLEKLHENMNDANQLANLDLNDGCEEFEGGYKIPLSLWNKLYKYQRTSVKWLWELNCQNCGGILGDEMGLGKTVMIISYLVGLSYSGLISQSRRYRGLGPVLIVSPVTVLHQWVREFHSWWPPFRVAVLHDSGSFTGHRSSLIHAVNKHSGILVTSYQGVVKHIRTLLNYHWHYVILDEGHKIRNPEAQITVAVKRFLTPHRIILSGSPIQNSLKELWSLFDFIFPGKLGTLPVFMQQFAVPITQGGYASATKLEVQTAYRCATVLRDTISPFLLRRMKADVRRNLSLPDKNEQVLFCGLTEEQRDLYRCYLDGSEVKSIMSGRLQVFVGLICLRKICNHPDLYVPKTQFEDETQLDSYGCFKRSGKMVVLHSILRLWKRQEHRVLLFTQSRQMLVILERFIIDQGFKYLKMDGGTCIGSRQPLIQRFNEDFSIFLFLLTTKVGGLGVNLTGADRVVIYDPDWNPSTDIQARERAWRIGQTRHVTIYRLLTAGTIEEKIYHRQIFKQFLTNKVLKDPKQQRFFKSNDLYELFTLSEGREEKTESSALFAGIGSETRFNRKVAKSKKLNKEPKSTNTNPSPLKAIDDGSSSQAISLTKPFYNNCKIRAHKSSMESDVVSDISQEAVYLEKYHSSNASRESFIPPSKSSTTRDSLTGCLASSNLTPSFLNVDGRLENIGLVNESLNNSVATKIVESKVLMRHEKEKKEERDHASLESTREVLKSEVLLDTEECVLSNEREDVSLDRINFKEEGLSEITSREVESNCGNSPRNVDLKVNSLIPQLNDNSEAELPLPFEIDDQMRQRMKLQAKKLSRKISKMSKCDAVVETKKRSKNKKRGKRFEGGERVSNLLKIRYYNKSPVEDDTETKKSHDDVVLQKLFSKSTLYTAFSHDAIVNASDPDYLLMESEAERVAKQAIEQVRASRVRCAVLRNDSSTRNSSLRKRGESKGKIKGQFGQRRSDVLFDPDIVRRRETKKLSGQEKMRDGYKESDEGREIKEHLSEEKEGCSSIESSFSLSLPEKIHFEGQTSKSLTSAELLARMRDRNKSRSQNDIQRVSQDINVNPPASNVNFPLFEVDHLSSDSDDPDLPSSLDSNADLEPHLELLSDIRNFIAFQASADGKASTAEVVRRFRNRLPTSKNYIFKALLKQICDFSRDASGVGFWYVKGEFR